MTTTWFQPLQLVQHCWSKVRAMTTHAPLLCWHWTDSTGEKHSGCRKYKLLQHLAWFIGRSQHVHTDIAPFPYFPFRSPGDSLSHLLWDTFPLSSPLCLLRLPPQQQSPGELFFFCVRTKTNKKPEIKGGCWQGAYLCRTLAGHHPAEQLSHGPCALSHPGQLRSDKGSDGKRAGGPQRWAGPHHPTQKHPTSWRL